MKYYCNPINVNYKYQFMKPMNGTLQIGREAADPTMIRYRNKYYIFASMSLGVWVSEDMAKWKSHPLPESLPLYDYAPDARVIGDYVYLSASSNRKNCSFYRTKNILKGPYEEIKGSFPFWDPNLFADDDGRIYFYWGCSSDKPLFGVELDPKTMQPLTEPIALIEGHPEIIGYERIGEDHSIMPATEEEAEQGYQAMLKQGNLNEEELDPDLIPQIKAYMRRRPYIEGAWMDKFQGRYYLQYACPGTEYNGYGNAVYIGDSPLGRFTLADNNPYSYKPSGFISGAGHGSTMQDNCGNLWHTATMRISKNFSMERRVGIWKAGIDEDGELFCNQRYGDWPIAVENGQQDPWRNPDVMLLSFGKKAYASSEEGENIASNVTDENIQTWWQASSNQKGQWIEIDIGSVCDVRVIQVNFADDHMNCEIPGKLQGEIEQQRFIDPVTYSTRWVLEGSMDGEQYQVIEDKSGTTTDLPHDLIVREDGVKVRYVRLNIISVPYGQKPCISGLRIFGKGAGTLPDKPEYTVNRVGNMDFDVKVEEAENRPVGYNILWGSSPEKLYHSSIIYGTNEKRIGALVSGRKYHVRVDAFNEVGITEGVVSEVI